MKNKRIWINLLLLFLIIAAACVYDITKENKDDSITGQIPAVSQNSAQTVPADESESKPQAPDTEQSEENIESQRTDNTNLDNKTEENQSESIQQKGEQEAAQNTENQNQEPSAEKPQEDSINTVETVLDKYNTQPVPEGKPQPIEWQDAEIDKDKELKCTLSVVCNTILDNMEGLNPEKKELVPEDGVIFAPQEVAFYDGESVFNILLREMKKNKIHMEFVMTPLYNSNYIEGIGNLYEFDCGELSGWMYKVNGWFPNYGASRYKLSEGDTVEWVYTCDLGRDIGETFMAEESEK